MGRVQLLDCTLRDGGYVNDWQFGEDVIRGFCRKIARTGVEIFEVGFIKGDTYDKNRAVFPDISCIGRVISPKEPGMIYVGMVDMEAPVPLERITPKDEASVDGIRVIFKKNRIEEAWKYCIDVKNAGYMLFVQLVGTDCYTDQEFTETVSRFQTLQPYAVSIVDSFGVIKRKRFLQYVKLADACMDRQIVLGYHAHNNLQQAFGNAEAMVELDLERDICIDACVFGMGRGAGNLNLELFAEYLNENYGGTYRIEPMLEIMDEYLNEIYKEKFWGYSLPLYLSATEGCHPNYAIYLAEKDSLTVKSFHEVLRGIPEEQKRKFTKQNAERIYKEYQENFLDDRENVEHLRKEIEGRTLILLAPGRNLVSCEKKIRQRIRKEKAVQQEPVIIAVNFLADQWNPDFIFSSNMRRYCKIQGYTEADCIVTSNMKDAKNYKYMVNFASYSSSKPEIIDNSGLMALKLFLAAGAKKVLVAGMDGYSGLTTGDYCDRQLNFDFSKEADQRNRMISEELSDIGKKMSIEFLTPSAYDIK